MAKTNRPKSCGFLIYRNDPARSFLLMRHTDRWDLPKGHVDSDETNLECAYRELEEETGIVASDVRLDEGFKFKHKYLVSGSRYQTEPQKEPQKKKLIIYLAELVRSVDIRVTEHAGFEWIDWNPPHDIQERTIDPLLEKVASHWASVES